MITDKITIELINLTIEQAEFFLKETKEFFPFATVYTSDKEFRPTSVFLENDNPSSNIVLDKLEIDLKKGFEDGRYLAVAIGSDIYLNSDNEKITAIEVKYSSAQESFNVYITYYFTKNNELILEESVTKQGTFKLI